MDVGALVLLMLYYQTWGHGRRASEGIGGI
jgi:hypothetical protein